MHKLNPVTLIKSALDQYRENFTRLSQARLPGLGLSILRPDRYIDLKSFNQYVIKYMDRRAKRNGEELTAFWANFKIAPKMNIDISLEMLYRGMCTEFGEDKANTWFSRLMSGFLGLQDQPDTAAAGA